MGPYIVRTWTNMELEVRSFEFYNRAFAHAIAKLVEANSGREETIVRIVNIEDQETVFMAAHGRGEMTILNNEPGRYCARCGCSENDACDGGCFWVGDGLCSECGELDLSDLLPESVPEERTA